MPLKRRGPLVERINFGIVRIYYEDIEEICTILGKVTSSVRIQADEFVATEPRDLLDMPSDVIDTLQIVATEPSVTITFSAEVAAVEATDADMSTLGALKRIEELMRGRRRRSKRFVWIGSTGVNLIALSTAIFGLVTAIAAAIAAPLADSSRGASESDSGRWVLIGFGGIVVVSFIVASIMGARRQAIVIPRPQKEAPPFWERNRDQIAISAVSTVLGTFLGIAATLLVQSLGR